MTLRWNWGTGIALVYGTFAACTLGFVVYAMEQSVDLVSPDYYAQSLRQDERMAATTRVTALGDRFAVAVRADQQDVDVTIPSAARDAATGSITFYRPSNAAADRVVPLAIDAGGVAHASFSGLAHGRWILKIEWRASGAPYYFEEPITLP
jgi:nitrogen fixation protein FixH